MEVLASSRSGYHASRVRIGDVENNVILTVLDVVGRHLLKIGRAVFGHAYPGELALTDIVQVVIVSSSVGTAKLTGKLRYYLPVLPKYKGSF